MRILLLFILLIETRFWSAEYQKLTFSDGKVLVGYFDEKKGSLSLDDGSTITVKVDDIIRREAAIPRDKPLDIPPPVKLPSDEPSTPKASELPGNRIRSVTLQQASDNLSQVRRRWLSVLRETNGQSTELPEIRAKKLAEANAELEAAVEAVRQTNEACHAEVMSQP